MKSSGEQRSRVRRNDIIPPGDQRARIVCERMGKERALEATEEKRKKEEEGDASSLVEASRST